MAMQILVAVSFMGSCNPVKKQKREISILYFALYSAKYRAVSSSKSLLEVQMNWLSTQVQSSLPLLHEREERKELWTWVESQFN